VPAGVDDWTMMGGVDRSRVRVLEQVFQCAHAEGKGKWRSPFERTNRGPTPCCLHHGGYDGLVDIMCSTDGGDRLLEGGGVLDESGDQALQKFHSAIWVEGRGPVIGRRLEVG